MRVCPLLLLAFMSFLPSGSYTFLFYRVPWARREGFCWKDPIQFWVFQGLSVLAHYLVSVFAPICCRSKLLWWWLNKALIYEYKNVALGVTLWFFFLLCVAWVVLNSLFRPGWFVSVCPYSWFLWLKTCTTTAWLFKTILFGFTLGPWAIWSLVLVHPVWYGGSIS